MMRKIITLAVILFAIGFCQTDTTYIYNDLKVNGSVRTIGAVLPYADSIWDCGASDSKWVTVWTYYLVAEVIGLNCSDTGKVDTIYAKDIFVDTIRSCSSVVNFDADTVFIDGNGSDAKLVQFCTLLDAASTENAFMCSVVTDAGANANVRRAMKVMLLDGGYTGNNQTYGAYLYNSAGGTGAVARNYGALGYAVNASATGNYGLKGISENAAVNVGVFGQSTDDVASADNFGLLGIAKNDGAGGFHTAGYFDLGDGTLPNLTFSSTIIGNNTNYTDNHLTLMDDLYPVFVVADNGDSAGILYVIDNTSDTTIITPSSITSDSLIMVTGNDSMLFPLGDTTLQVIARRNSATDIYGINVRTHNAGAGINYGGRFYVAPEGTGIRYGIYTRAMGTEAGVNDIYGIYGIGEVTTGTTSTSKLYGGFFYARSCGIGKKHGVYGKAIVNPSPNDSIYGVYGYADALNADTDKPSFGGHFVAVGDANDTIIGVYGKASGGAINLGGVFDPLVWVLTGTDTTKIRGTAVESDSGIFGVIAVATLEVSGNLVGTSDAGEIQWDGFVWELDYDSDDSLAIICFDAGEGDTLRSDTINHILTWTGAGGFLGMDTPGGADTFRIYDDGDTTYIASDNPFAVDNDIRFDENAYADTFFGVLGSSGACQKIWVDTIYGCSEVVLTPDTVKGDEAYFEITKTLGSADLVTYRAVACSVTTAGTGNSIVHQGIACNLMPGYTGNNPTYSGYYSNLVTGNAGVNYGLYGACTGARATSYNVGLYGTASANTAVNVGVWGLTPANALNTEYFGVLGMADHTTSIGAYSVAGYFYFDDASLPALNIFAALVADNAGSVANIFAGRDNSSNVFEILDGGDSACYVYVMSKTDTTAIYPTSVHSDSGIFTDAVVTTATVDGNIIGTSDAGEIQWDGFVWHLDYDSDDSLGIITFDRLEGDTLRSDTINHILTWTGTGGFLGMDAPAGADTFRLYDDGDTCHWSSDNPHKISANTVIQGNITTRGTMASTSVTRGQASFTRNTIVDTVPGITGVSTNSFIVVTGKMPAALTTALTWSYLAAESILVHIHEDDTTGHAITYCWIRME